MARSCAIVVALLEMGEHDCWFQQDGATSPTLNEAKNMLMVFLGDCVISKNVLPCCSPDLTLPNFCLLCHLKQRAYKDNSCTQNDFKVAFWQAIKQCHSYSEERHIVEYLQFCGIVPVRERWTCPAPVMNELHHCII
jgi:hypothetical protein